MRVIWTWVTALSVMVIMLNMGPVDLVEAQTTKPAEVVDDAADPEVPEMPKPEGKLLYDQSYVVKNDLGRGGGLTEMGYIHAKLYQQAEKKLITVVMRSELKTDGPMSFNTHSVIVFATDQAGVLSLYSHWQKRFKGKNVKMISRLENKNQVVKREAWYFSSAVDKDKKLKGIYKVFPLNENLGAIVLDDIGMMVLLPFVFKEHGIFENVPSMAMPPLYGLAEMANGVNRANIIRRDGEKPEELIFDYKPQLPDGFRSDREMKLTLTYDKVGKLMRLQHPFGEIVKKSKKADKKSSATQPGKSE